MGLFDKKPVSAAGKLAVYWKQQSPVTQGYFEELYQRFPKDVSEVLVGEALLPDDVHKTLTDWADKSELVDAGGMLDVSKIMIEVEQALAEPATPLADQKFTIRWKGKAGALVPDREDRLEVLDGSGGVVKSWTMSYGQAAPGAVDGEFDVDGLPEGFYLVRLELNVDGVPIGDPPGDQGFQTLYSFNMEVGMTKGAIAARYFEDVQKITTTLLDVLDELSRPEPPSAQEEIVDKVRSCAVGFQTIFGSLKDKQADGTPFDYPIKTKIDTYVPGGDGLARVALSLMSPDQFEAAKDRLRGVTAAASAEDIPGYASRFCAWIEECLLPH